MLELTALPEAQTFALLEAMETGSIRRRVPADATETERRQPSVGECLLVQPKGGVPRKAIAQGDISNGR